MINKLEASTRDKITSVSLQALIQGKGDSLSIARMLKEHDIEGTYIKNSNAVSLSIETGSTPDLVCHKS